jgi:hypothetical protein
MANAFKNQTLIIGLFIRMFENLMLLSKHVDRQVGEKEFAGSKNTGGTVYVKRPVRAKSTAGAAITEGQLTDIEQATVPVTVDTYRKTAFTLTQEQRALNDVQIMELLKPFAIELVQDVENAIAAAGSRYFPNAIGTPGSTPASFLEVGSAFTRLFGLGVPADDINAFYNPQAGLYIADALKASPDQGIAKTALQKAFIKRISNMDLYNCQSLTSHTVGVNTGTPLVNGDDQDTTYALSKDTQSQTINTDGWTNDTANIVSAGTNITFAGVYEINANSRVANKNLQEFSVINTAASGASTGPAVLTISPAIIVDGPYQTVSAAPADGAAITVLGSAATSYAQNLAFHKNAITLAFAKLPEMEKGSGVVSKRVVHDGISMNYSYGSDISNMSTIYRFDLLFGVKVQNPCFGIRTYGE